MTSLAVKVHSSAAVQVHTSVSFVVGRTVRKPLRLGLAAVNTCGVTARRPPHLLALVCYAKAGGQKGKQGSSRKTTSCQLIEVDPAGLDIWRLDAVIELLLEGGVSVGYWATLPRARLKCSALGSNDQLSCCRWASYPQTRTPHWSVMSQPRALFSGCTQQRTWPLRSPCLSFAAALAISAHIRWACLQAMVLAARTSSALLDKRCLAQ